MRVQRWTIAGSAATIVFIAAWWVAHVIGGLDHGAAAEIAAFAGGIILTALGYWAGHEEKLDDGPTAETASAPSHTTETDPKGTKSQIIVGDVPGEAVAWQQRVELLDRLTVMAGQTRTVVVCAVTGQRGLGKTQLAGAYARARVAQGWPVVVWTVADNPANLVNGLAALAEAAGIRQPDTDPANAARAALAWLRAHPGPCLLVYDNALDPDVIAEWTPAVGAVHTVITTTRHDFANLGEPLDVTLFTLAESVAYLRARTGLTDDTGAAQVADQLGRLPLALAQAGAVIGPHRRYRAYHAYLDRFARVSVAELLPRPAGHPYPHGAAEAILLALDDLAPDDPGGHARALLDRLAVLAPTGVDAALLARLADDENAAAILAERSLTMPTTDTDRTVVHRLVQRVVREHNQHRGCLNGVLTETADRLYITARDIGEQWTTRTRIADYAQHVQYLAEPPAEDATTKRVLNLRVWMVHWLLSVHHLTSVIDLGEALAADCERLLGPDHRDTLAARHNLARAYQEVGRLDEAVALLEHTLADYERVLGSDHLDTLALRIYLAHAYQEGGRLDDGIVLLERTLADFERVFGPDHRQTLTSRHNLAYAYHEVGRLDEAIILYQHTLADRERLLGPDHPQTLASRHNLAYAYHEVGRLDEAIVLHERVLAECERVLGSDHPDTLAARHNLARVYRALGRLDQAIMLHKRTLADRERVLGPDHPGTLASRHNLAYAYQEVGRLDEAIVLYERVLADGERVLGPNHPDTLASRHSLAYAYCEVGRLDEAIVLYERVLADRERVLGPDRPDTLASRHNLAYAYREVGRLDEAIFLFQRTLADRERVLGPNHPDTLASRHSLAYAYCEVGRLDEAIVLYERVLADRERVLGPDHPDTLASRHNLAYVYKEVGRLDEAITLHERVLAEGEQVLGSDHPDTLIARHSLASAYQARLEGKRRRSLHAKITATLAITVQRVIRLQHRRIAPPIEQDSTQPEQPT